MSDFVNLHVHSDGSTLDGYSRVGQIARRARELGQSAVALTDHGDVNQHYAFQKACQAEGVTPLLGMEGYWSRDIEGTRQNAKDERGRTRYPKDLSHICFIAQNDEGLSNLWALSSAAYDADHHFYRPLADPALMRRHAAGIYASDGCLMTRMASYVEHGDLDGARQELGVLADIFGERFYMELHTWQYMQPNTEEEHRLNTLMTGLNQAKVELSAQMGIPLVVVNDAHHAYPEHWELKDLVWRFKPGSNPDRAEEVSLAKADHMMGDEELFFWMDRHGISRDVVVRAIRHSRDIAASCTAEIKAPLLGMPSFTGTDSGDNRRFLDLVEEGFKNKVLANGLDAEAYMARVEEEVSLIVDKGFAGYFLITADYVRAAKTGTWNSYVTGGPPIPMLVGPGRGSAGGSLVAWLLGITALDPIKYGLLFSRFLSPGRKGFPDIDVDFPRSHHADIKAYLGKRWGEDHVCSICTIGRNKAKGTLKDLGRAMKIPYDKIEEMSKIIEQVTTILAEAEQESDDDEPDLPWNEVIAEKGGALAPYARDYPELFEKMEGLVGVARTTGVHAAAVLISNKPIPGTVPTRIKKGVLATQFDMYDIEELGGLKSDLLALRHLDALDSTARLVAERHGLDIDWEAFTDEQYYDPDIWHLADEGKLAGIFQIGTAGGTESAIEFRPRNVREVADLVSIIRPGVRDAGLHDLYIRRRHGQEPVTYDHPMMEPIVGDTYGVLVYQEQLMRTVTDLASFTADEADDLRKAVGKKNMDKLMQLKEKFADGCLANPQFMEAHIDARARTVVDKIWASIEASGRYSFNKCVAGSTRVKLSAVGSTGGDMAVGDMWRRLYDDSRLEGQPCWYGCAYTGYQGKCQTCRVWRQKFRDPRRGLKGWSLGEDGRLHPNRIVDVHRNGVRPVWRLVLADGRSITATTNHRHMTPRGWQEVGQLGVGDELLVCGAYESQVYDPERSRTTVADPDYRGALLPNQQRNGANSLGYRDGGFLALKEWTTSQQWACTEPGCGRSRGAGDRIERAHLDGDRTNNHPSNLAMRCASHHKQYDYRVNGRRRRGEKGYSALPVQIVAIEYVGEEETYDLEMADPYHSWVGDGIITHNSHALGYALISTWEIWAKHYYPAEFVVSCMQVDQGRINSYIRDARRNGIQILPPDINESGSRFALQGDAIRYGLEDVFGVGHNAYLDIVSGRPYRSFEDFLVRGRSSKTVTVNLIKIGAFDRFGPRAEMLRQMERFRVIEKVAPTKRATLTEQEKDAIWADKRVRLAHEYALETPDFDDLRVVYEIEKELVGNFITADPMGPYVDALSAVAVRTPAALRRMEEGERAVVGGQLSRIKVIRVRKAGRNHNKEMAFLGIEWNNEDFDVTVFPDLYERYKVLLEQDAPVACEVVRDERGCHLKSLERLDLI